MCIYLFRFFWDKLENVFKLKKIDRKIKVRMIFYFLIKGKKAIAI